MRWNLILVLSLAALPALAEPVDNCATLLGSLSVELRHARTLPHDARGTFSCPRVTRDLIGASKQRILNSLGPPDAASSSQWSYFFSGAPAGERPAGIPELAFEFDALQQVGAVRCGPAR